jgi:hypothetical protein
VIGDLASLEEPGGVGRLKAAHGATGEEVAEIVARLRTDAPDDPFWKGVAGIDVDAGGVAVRFNDWLDPRDVESGGARLQCHLYDDEALARAREVARNSAPPGKTGVTSV